MTYAYRFNADNNTVTIGETHREPETYDRVSLELAIANTKKEHFITRDRRYYRLAKYRGALAFLLSHLAEFGDLEKDG